MSHSLVIEQNNHLALINRTHELAKLEELLRSIIELHAQDETHLPPKILIDMNVDGFQYLLVRNSTPNTMTNLSPREQDIARLVARGFPNKSIALVLGISPCTVATYLRRIFVKLNVNSRAEMVARLHDSNSNALFAND